MGHVRTPQAGDVLNPLGHGGDLEVIELLLAENKAEEEGGCGKSLPRSSGQRGVPRPSIGVSHPLLSITPSDTQEARPPRGLGEADPDRDDQCPQGHAED